MNLGASSQLSGFLDGLGPAQLVGRQTLATPAIGKTQGLPNKHSVSILLKPCRPSGDIQIGMMEKKGQLEVEVIRARGLVQKPGSKSLPGESLQINF